MGGGAHRLRGLRAAPLPSALPLAWPFRFEADREEEDDEDEEEGEEVVVVVVVVDDEEKEERSLVGFPPRAAAALAGWIRRRCRGGGEVDRIVGEFCGVCGGGRGRALGALQPLHLLAGSREGGREGGYLAYV